MASRSFLPPRRALRRAGSLLAAAWLVLPLACRNMNPENTTMVPRHEENMPASWKGHHIDQLIHNWGAPSSHFDLDHGGKSYLFEHARYVDGEERYCFAVFVTNRNGIIRSSSVGGNVAQCNWILASGKRSPRLGKGVNREQR